VDRPINLLVAAFFASRLIGFCSGVSGKEQNHQEIILDAVCAMPEARNPKLPPGNPAPSTRRMAELLSDIDRKLPAAGYMSERFVTALQKQLAVTTNLGERLKVQFQLGIEQTQAGHSLAGVGYAADYYRAAIEPQLSNHGRPVCCSRTKASSSPA